MSLFHTGRPGPTDSVFIFIQETFRGHVLHVRHDAGSHALRTTQTGGRYSPALGRRASPCGGHRASCPQCLVWVLQGEGWVGAAHLGDWSLGSQVWARWSHNAPCRKCLPARRASAHLQKMRPEPMDTGSLDGAWGTGTWDGCAFMHLVGQVFSGCPCALFWVGVGQELMESWLSWRLTPSRQEGRFNFLRLFSVKPELPAVLTLGPPV